MAKSKLKEIASLCKVSTTTVTRSFHNDSKISAEKRAEILALAKEFGYEPKKYKKEHIKSDRKIVALIGDCELCSNIVDAADPILAKEGITLIVGNSSDNTKREIEKLNELKKIVDGFFIVPCMTEDPYNLEFIDTLSEKMPVIVLIRDAGLDNVTSIYYSLYENNKKAFELLIQNGHKNIAMISNVLGSKQNTDKIIAYQDALRNNNLPIKGEYIVICEGKSDDIEKKVTDLLLTHPEITAIVTSNRTMTIGTLKALSNLNIKVGENIALIANFNSNAVVNYSEPLTCIKAYHNTLGTMGANQMIYMLKNKKDFRKNITRTAIETTFEKHGTEKYPTIPIINLNISNEENIER